MFDLLSSLAHTTTEIIMGIIIGLSVLLGFPAQNSEQVFYQFPATSLLEETKPATTTTPSTPSPTEKDAAPEPPQTTTSDDPPNKTAQDTPIAEDLPEPETVLSTTELNETARAALVNVFCTSTEGSSLSATGSGVIIDPRGVILTNAHLGQYFLLEKDPALVKCRIRTGGPAKITYDAELLYISPLWIQENAGAITEREPLGTGEHDFALLRITDTINEPDHSGVFSYTPPNIAEKPIQKGDAVFLAGYPAGFLGGQVITRDLYPSSTMTSIVGLFTFNVQTIDVISLAGSILAQQGSSGAGVLDARTGNLIGIVVTSSTEESTDARTLNAITLAHINRSLLDDLGATLREYLNANLADRARTFQETISPTLRSLLIQELDK